MKINFTKKQYRTLLEIFYLASWMVDSDKEHKNECRESYNELEGILVSHAKDMGAEDLLFKGGNRLEISLENEDSLQEDIDQYNNSVFWEELSMRFSDKLIAAKYSEKDWTKLTQEEKFFLRSTIGDLLDEEFCDNGLDKLEFPQSFVKTLWKKVEQENSLPSV